MAESNSEGTAEAGCPSVEAAVESGQRKQAPAEVHAEFCM